MALPPLIDRELFFGNPEIAGAQLSPDGKYLAFLKPWHDTLNIWVKGVAEPFDSARLLTAETRRPIPGYLWSRDSRFVCYVKDNDGDENFNVYAVDPGAPPASGSEAPASRDLTGLTGVRVILYAAPKSEPDTIFYGVNDRDPSWHDLYRVFISTGEKTLLRLNTERISSWEFDLAGNLRLALRSASNGDTEILRVDPGGFTKVFSCNVFETARPVRFHKDGRRVYLVTDQGEAREFTELVLFDPAAGEIEKVESDPERRVDFGVPAFDEVTDELVYTKYQDDPIRRYFRDADYERDFQWLAEQFPGAQLNILSKTLDERMWVIAASSDVEPGAAYIFDRAGRTLTVQYRVRENVPRESLAAMQSIGYPSSDGLEIPAYLTLPKGVAPANLPTIIFPHGGPWFRDTWGYNPVAQFFANRGYAVLMPNYRGSTGYGKRFLDAGNGEWGRKMQDDLTWGVKHLVARGVADPQRIGIFGGSYGGYAALAGVAFTPDLYRAAVDLVGPCNLLTFFASLPPYWEAGRIMIYSRMADPTTPEGKAWAEERSPLNFADRIRTPLFVIQGANDPRVNRAEAEQIVIALRDRGFPVEYMLAEDEGHGFIRPVNNMAMFMACEKFLARHLGGRYQESGTPEVVGRLAELMVDPATVTLGRKVDAASVGALTPAADLTPTIDRYQASISLGPQKVSVAIAIEIREQDGAWAVTSTQQSAMGSGSDTLVLRKGTLAPIRRSMSQGPLAIDLEFGPGQITGAMTMNGQKTPICVDPGGPLFPAPMQCPQAFAALPLADAYTAYFRNFDVQSQKIKLMHLAVSSGGDTDKIEITSAEGGPDRATLWVSKSPRRVVKIETALPAAGGALLTAELQ